MESEENFFPDLVESFQIFIDFFLNKNFIFF